MLRLFNLTNKRCYSSALINPFPESLAVKTPQLKHRKTATIQLQNGLKCCLISDPLAPKASAALSVEAGSWMDTQEGIAHFLEHMLFLGTKKYPLEYEYERYIMDAGGNLNAYTSSDHSLYYFDGITPDALSGALDRFSRFFYEPLFNDSCVERERNAVDQEYKRNIEEDGWRMVHVRKALANQNHPFATFNTGNLETMKLIDPKYLKTWFAENYTSNKMNLSILGKDDLPQLISYAEKYFSPIKSTDKKAIKSFGRITPEKLSKSLLYIEPLKDLKDVSLSWEIPYDAISDLDTKPGKLVGHVLGHEGENSLLSTLKKQGLVEGLSAGKSEMGLNNVFFEISLALTDKGLNYWQSVVKQVYDALRDFADTKTFPKYIFDEINTMSKLRWQFQQRDGGIVNSYVSMLRKEPLDTFPLKCLMINKFDNSKVMDLVGLLKPETSLITITSKTQPPSTNISKLMTEKWMKARYGTRPWSKEECKLWEIGKSSSEYKFAYPSQNRFLPENLEILDPSIGKESSQAPTVVEKGESGICYYMRDNQFELPKIMLSFNIRTPAIKAGDAKSLCLATLYNRFVLEALNELSYEASSAGLHYNVWIKNGNGVSISIDGFSEKALKLLSEVMIKVRDPNLTEPEFKNYKASITRDYQNAGKNSSLQQTFDKVSKLIMTDFCSSKELASAIEHIQFSDLVEFTEKKLFAQTYTEAFCGGNLDEATAKKAWELVKTTLSSSSPISRDLVESAKPKDLSSMNSRLVSEMDVEINGNAIVWICEGMMDSTNKNDIITKKVGLEILSNLLKEPFYTELRTKQQTGYVVGSGLSKKEKTIYLQKFIQSSTHTPKDLLNRVEMFIKSFLNDLHNPNDVETNGRFTSIKTSMLARLHTPFDTINSKLGHYNFLAFEQEQEWDYLKKKIEVVEQITFDQVRKIAVESLSEKNVRQISVLTSGKRVDEKGSKL